MSDDIRSLIGNAMEATGSSAATPAAPAAAPEPPPAEAPASESDASATPAATEAPAPAPGGAEQPPTVNPVHTSVTPTADTPAAPKAPEVRAPQSWKPALREHWSKVPPEVQAEVVRREREVQSALQEASEAKRTAGAFQQVLSPYMGMIQAEGQDPIKAVAGLLQTAAALRTAPPAHKAALVAQIITGYGIDVEAINAVMQGQAPQQQPTQTQHFDPNDLIRQAEERVVQRFQQQAKQATYRSAQGEFEQFVSSGSAEFLDDVREDMADIMELAAKRGRKISLQDAYETACKQNPDVSKVLEQRAKHAQATATNAATQRAKAAASSVQSRPASAPLAANAGDVRSDLEATLAKLSVR